MDIVVCQATEPIDMGDLVSISDGFKVKSYRIPSIPVEETHFKRWVRVHIKKKQAPTRLDPNFREQPFGVALEDAGYGTNVKVATYPPGFRVFSADFICPPPGMITQSGSFIVNGSFSIKK